MAASRVANCRLTPRRLKDHRHSYERISAVEGAGVAANGQGLEKSKRLPLDFTGRPLPEPRRRDYRRLPGKALVMLDYFARQL